MLVIGLESASIEALQEALDELGYESQSLLDSNEDLVLVQRDPTIIDVDKAEVILTYRHFSMNEFQDLANPPTGELVFTTEGGLQERASQTDENDDPIILGYKYPNTADQGLYKNMERQQAGEVQFRIPTKVKRLVGTLDWDDPDGVVDGILGKVNYAEWMGGGEGEWMCTGAKYSPWSRRDSANVNKFEFTFEHNPDGWDPQVVFVHEISGKVVSDWKTNAGAGGHASYAEVSLYEPVAFGSYFAGFGLDIDEER